MPEVLASNPMSDMPSSVSLTSSPHAPNDVAQAEYDRDILRLCTWRCIPDDMLDGVFRKAGTVRFVSYMRQKPGDPKHVAVHPQNLNHLKWFYG